MVGLPLMTIAVDTDEQRRKGYNAMRARLAFYGSTPAYKVVLDVEGWGDLQPELNTLSKRADWAAMSKLITDDIVEALCVVGTPEQIPALVTERFGDTLQRVSLDTPDADPERAARILAAFRKA